MYIFRKVQIHIFREMISINQAHAKFKGIYVVNVNNVLGSNQSSGRILHCTSKVLRYWR